MFEHLDGAYKKGKSCSILFYSFFTEFILIKRNRGVAQTIKEY